jgi:hypothetical protein
LILVPDSAALRIVLAATLRLQQFCQRGQNFGRKTQKGPKKIVRGRENLGPNFWQMYQKRAEKVPNFFVVIF